MAKKLMVWALALSFGLGGLSYSIYAADEAKKEGLAKIEKSEASAAQAEGAEASNHKKKKKKAETPTEKAPDAKASEGK